MKGGAGGGWICAAVCLAMKRLCYFDLFCPCLAAALCGPTSHVLPACPSVPISPRVRTGHWPKSCDSAPSCPWHPLEETALLQHLDVRVSAVHFRVILTPSSLPHPPNLHLHVPYFVRTSRHLPSPRPPHVGMRCRHAAPWPRGHPHPSSQHYAGGCGGGGNGIALVQQHRA